MIACSFHVFIRVFGDGLHPCPLFHPCEYGSIFNNLGRKGRKGRKTRAYT